MNFRAEVMEKLRKDQSAPANRALTLLKSEHVQPISGEPASTTASEALRLWRTRLRNTSITNKKIAGLPELVRRLETVTPQKKVDHFSFNGHNSAITVLFEKTNGHLIGSIVVREKSLRS